mgnify:CR=1 FL=1
MSKRYASMHYKRGAIGVIHLKQSENGKIKLHPLSGARCQVICNRRSNLEVRLTQPHNVYKTNQIIIIGMNDFIPDGYVG